MKHGSIIMDRGSGFLDHPHGQRILGLGHWAQTDVDVYYVVAWKLHVDDASHLFAVASRQKKGAETRQTTLLLLKELRDDSGDDKTITRAPVVNKHKQ